MFDKRLLSMVPGAMRHIAADVALQWVALLANVVLFVSVGGLLQELLEGEAAQASLAFTVLVALACVAVRLVCQAGAQRQGLAASSLAKRSVRTLVYDKLVRLGPSYRETVATSEATQLCVEGVEQLEAYFGSYLPQLFYSLIASITLFGCLAPLCTPAAIVLLCCVPLIPVSIVAVMKIAKRVMGNYWHSYTDLGAMFLESIQGLTTLKVFGADGRRHKTMNDAAEGFRKATMRLLTMRRRRGDVRGCVRVRLPGGGLLHPTAHARVVLPHGDRRHGGGRAHVPHPGRPRARRRHPHRGRQVCRPHLHGRLLLL